MHLVGQSFFNKLSVLVLAHRVGSGRAVASWLVCLSLDRAVQVRALAEVIALLSQCLSPPRYIDGYW